MLAKNENEGFYFSALVHDVACQCTTEINVVSG